MYKREEKCKRHSSLPEPPVPSENPLPSGFYSTFSSLLTPLSISFPTTPLYLNLLLFCFLFLLPSLACSPPSQEVLNRSPLGSSFMLLCRIGIESRHHPELLAGRQTYHIDIFVSFSLPIVLLNCYVCSNLLLHFITIYNLIHVT